MGFINEKTTMSTTNIKIVRYFIKISLNNVFILFGVLLSTRLAGSFVLVTVFILLNSFVWSTGWLIQVLSSEAHYNFLIHLTF